MHKYISTFLRYRPDQLIALIFLSLVLPVSNAVAAPQSFTKIAPAISAAKKGNQYLLFVLLKNLSKESEAVEKIIAEDLTLSAKEFIVVRCKMSQSAHRALFKDKFQLDPELAPMAAVSDATGGLVASASGSDATSYRTLIQLARAKAGFEMKADKIRKTLAKVAEDDHVTDGEVGKKIAAMGDEPLFLIKKRTWKFKNGKTLRAGLVEAKGETGVFVGEDGIEVERNFNDLSAEDIELLKKTIK